MRVVLVAFSILILCSAGGVAADLAAAKAEPNLERRSAKALENARLALDAAGAAYRSGDLNKMKAAIEEVNESVELAYTSLKDSGKKPRNNKWYKQAELQTRELARRLRDFSDRVSVMDRDPVDATAKRVQEIHEGLLLAIMSKGK